MSTSSKRLVLAATIATACLTGAVCSRQPDAETPPVISNANLPAADMGGAVELVSYMYGPGFIGRRLIDGLNEPTWSVTETPAEETMFPRLRINTLGQVLEEPVTIAPDQTTSIALRIDGDRFVIRR